MNADNEILALLKLNAALFFNSDKADALLSHYGCAEEVIKLTAADLFAEGIFTLDAAAKAVKAIRDFNAEEELALAEKNGITILSRTCPNYPRRLSAIYDPPAVLYVKGSNDKFDMPAAGIVGTRQPSPYGLRLAAEIAAGLVNNGIAIASGLARGIDSAAHRAAVSAGGITWAALGSGLLKIYPPENRRLASEIIDSGGAIISEYPLQYSARPASFPRRNRIISGLSMAVLVAEGSFKSGSMITARCALEQGREVLALPGQAGNKNAQGPNYLIKNGACLAETADDIIACLPQEVKISIKNRACLISKKKNAIENLSHDAAALYALLSKEENGLNNDEILLRGTMNVPQASAAIFELEASGLICQLAGRYVIK